MINVDFTTNSGETIYSYSWQNCGGNKNVNFELENPSYTWCTVTHTPENSKVKIHADAVPERQRDPRSAKVLMKVNDVTCDEFFYVSQPGQPCGCSAFTPISIGATFPSSGAAVGTVIGSYYNDTTCDASKITITGDLQAGAVGGQIKLTSAVGAYNDGRTFNVIFNYDGSECTRGTCTQTAASCRCTSISATPYTFAAPDTCGDIRPVTVLTIDGCCSIVTGITGTDSDKFTITTATSGDYKVVKACPSSTNISTSTDRTATVSVTATCGNDTCSSSTTLTQEHSGCTPSECTCYTVSNASVVDGSNLTCESTSATVRWNFTGYIITKNADCTTAKTQVVEYYQDGTVNFLPNTGGETPVTRSGEIEWYDHLVCIGNTCGQSNVKVPWTVELPACSSCDCNCWYLLDSETFIKYLPASGVTSSQLVAKYYHSLEKFTPSCYNSIGLGNPYVIYPRGQAVSINSHVTAYTGTYNGQPATVLELWVDSLDANPETNKIRKIDYPFNIDGNYCISFTLEQEGAEIQCTCEYFVESGLIRPIKTKIPNAGTSGQLVEIASGNTHGCGTLVGYINATTMIDSFSAQTIEITERIDGRDVVVDTDYHWWASFTENGGDGTPRSCSLSFQYIDAEGVTQDCRDSFLIEQNSTVCSCPSLTTSALTVNLSDGKKKGGFYYGSVDPYFIGVINHSNLAEYSYPHEGYMCQFILAESDSSWCSAFTSYARSDYYGTFNTSIYIIAEANFTDSTRTAVIDCFGIANAVSGSGANTTVEVFRPNRYYSKSLADEKSNYDECQHFGTVTINQPPFGPCTCYSSDFGLIGGTAAHSGTALYDWTSYTWEFTKPVCGEATYSYKFVDENGDEIQQPEWITGVTLDTTYDNEKVGLVVLFDENYKEGEDTSPRRVRIVFTMTLTDTRTGVQTECNEELLLIQEGTCTCDLMIVAPYWNNVDYRAYSYSEHTTYKLKITVLGKCDIYAAITDVSFEPDSSYNWIRVISVYETYPFDGYVWVEIEIDENPNSTNRTAYFTIRLNNGTDCTRTIGITQNSNPCTNCTSLMNKIMHNNHIYVNYDVSGEETLTKIASLPSSCSNVRHLDYSLVNTGDGINWASAGTDSNENVYVMVTSTNPSENNRSLDVNIIPLDSDGNPVISNCSRNCTVIQYGTGATYCKCNSITDDASKLHITAGTLDGSVYKVDVTPGQQNYVIGYIQLSESLPSCLDYIVSNTQASAVELRIEEDTSYGSRMRYKLIVNVSANACGSASSDITRIDTSVTPIATCWNQIIEYGLPICQN